MNKYKLGKKVPINKKSVSFGDFLKLMPLTPLVDLAPLYSYDMLGNDSYGDCVPVGEAHSKQTTTGLLTGVQYKPTLSQVEAWYKTQNPGFPQEDNGMDVQTFLEYLVKNKEILGFARLDFHNPQVLQAAIYLDLATTHGFQLQDEQLGRQFDQGLWDYVPHSPFIGGHDVCLTGYNATTKRYSLVSWGRVLECTQAFVDNQMDEAWFILRQEHVDHPSFRDHFDLKGFADAISTLTNGKVIIPIGPSPVPPPPVPPTPIPPNPIPVPPSHYIFTKDLHMGSNDTDVLELQKYLNSHGFPLASSGIGSKGQETKYFGTLTLSALEKFQTSINLRGELGFVGSFTRAVLNNNMNTSKIYDEAKLCLDKHITLDDSVPPDLGCAEAVSYVLKNAGVNIPPKGIAGTSALYTWLKSNFTEVTNPQAGDVIISPTGMSSKGSTHGHTGIVALYGVLSNDSDTGLFMEKYTLDTWKNYFGTIMGFPVYYFRV